MQEFEASRLCDGYRFLQDLPGEGAGGYVRVNFAEPGVLES